MIDQWQEARQKAFNEFRSNRFNEAALHYSQAIKIAHKLGAGDPHVGIAQLGMARALAAKQNLSSALMLYKAAAERLKPADSVAAGQDSDNEVMSCYCDALAGIAEVEDRLGHPSEADVAYQRAMDFASTKQLGQQLTNLTFAYEAFLKAHGRFGEAKALQQETETVVDVAAPLPSAEEQLKFEVDRHRRNAEAAKKTQDWQTAEFEFKQALRYSDRIKDRVVAGNIATELGVLYSRQQRWGSAARAYRVALLQYDIAHAASVVRRSALCGMIDALCKLNRSADAVPLATQLVNDSREINSADQHELFQAWQLLALVREASGNLAGAEEAQHAAYEIALSHASPTSAQTTLQMCALGNACWNASDHKELHRVFDDYLGRVKKLPDSDRLYAARLIDDYAEVLLKSTKAEEARAFLELADAVLGGTSSGGTKETVRNARLLQRAHLRRLSSHHATLLILA